MTALCVGPEKAVDAVRKALQMGADKGIHVVDDAIAGSDAIATSLVLAKAIEKAGSETKVDLVLCGMASTDACHERRTRRCSPSGSSCRRSRWPRSSSPRATRSGSSATATPRPR